MLPLYLDDLPRASLLLFSIQKNIDKKNEGLVSKMLIVVPDSQHGIILSSLKGYSDFLSFPIDIIRESILFERPTEKLQNVDGYILQMSIKLLIAKLVDTPFYMTLDADVIMLRNFAYRDIVFIENNDVDDDDGCDDEYWENPRALFHNEGREVHPHWWEGSERLMGVEPSADRSFLGFGVTPALLSTFGICVYECVCVRVCECVCIRERERK